MALNPRLQVVLPQQVYDDLARIARYSDTTMSRLVSTMVVEGSEVLHQLADTLEQAHGLSMRLPGSVTAKLDAISRRVETVSDDAQAVLDEVQEQALEQREKRGTKLPRRPALPGNTP